LGRAWRGMSPVRHFSHSETSRNYRVFGGRLGRVRCLSRTRSRWIYTLAIQTARLDLCRHLCCAAKTPALDNDGDARFCAYCRVRARTMPVCAARLRAAPRCRAACYAPSHESILCSLYTHTCTYTLPSTTLPSAFPTCLLLPLHTWPLPASFLFFICTLPTSFPCLCLHFSVVCSCRITSG